MTKTILWVVVAIAVVGLVAILASTNLPLSTSQDQGGASSTTVGEPSSSLPSVTGPGGSKTPTVSGPTSSKNSGLIVITAPAGGEEWVIKENHSIQWSKESLGNGAIYLVDAKTGLVVGTISPSLTLHQKNFTWDSSDVLLSRTSSQRKTIEPGQYRIRISFEVGNKQTIESGMFSLIYPAQKTVGTQSFIIKNYIATPAQVTVKRGDVIYITNNDAISYKLSMSGFSPLTLVAGQTLTFPTTALTVGNYEFYSEQYSGLKMGIVVQ